MSLALAAALVLSALIGLALGLLGSGGSIITLPVLVYVAGVSPGEAVGMSLVVVGGTSLLGSILQYRRGFLDVRVALLFGAAGMVGALAGAQFTHLLSGPMLMVLFAVLMAAVGIRMLREGPTRRAARCEPGRCCIVGGIVGILTGFLGVGGGFLIVPALALFGGLDMERAIGTSLAVIAVNCFSGLAGQLRHSRVDWALTTAFLTSAMTGMIIGVISAGYASPGSLKRAFAWFVLAVAAVLAWRNGSLLALGHH